MNMAGGMKRLASLVGLLLSIISAIFTIKLLVTFATNGSEKLLYGGFGACVQTAQTLLYLYGVFCIWRGEPGKAIPGIIMFLFLFFLSLVGTIGFFATTDSGQAGKAKLSDVNYKSMTDRLEQIDSQIQAVRKLLAECPATHNKHCIQPKFKALDALKAERAELQKSIASFKAVPETDALYRMIAEFFQGPDPAYEQVQQVKFLMFVLYSLALDLTSVVLLAYSAGLLNFMGSADPFPDDGTGRSGGGIRKSCTGQTFTQPAVSGGGTVAKGDGAEQFRVWAEQQKMMQEQAERRYQHTEEERRRQSEQQNALFMQMLKRLEDSPYSKEQSAYTPYGKEQSAYTPYSKEQSAYNKIEPEPNLNTDLLLRYAEMLYPVKSDGSLNGRISIADRLDIPYKDAEKYHRFLKNAGMVNVSGNKTYPVMEKPELLKILSNGNGERGQS